MSSQKIIQSTKIYDRTGETLLYEIHGDEKRTSVPFSDIPEVVKQATISIEDGAFYDHPAFDWRGVVRALFANIVERRVVQGGSTITQQLAKASFLAPERTIWRKIKELILAVRLEERYSKDEILALYLNQIPYGGGAYGVEAATQAYFNKHAKDLTLNEAVMLAALPKAPSYYSPWGNHADELEQRKNLILKRMHELGYIDEEELARASATMPRVSARPKSGIKAPHFVAYLEDYLSKKYSEEVVQSGGLTILSSLDWGLEQIAEKAVKDGATRNSDLYNGRNAALIAEDPQTGQILAMVGSKDYFSKPEPEGCTPGKNCLFEGNFNVASQGLRQPGSAFKPFAYLTAFQKGLTPETIVWDAPTEFSPNNPACPVIPNYDTSDDTCYHPQNFDEQFRGPVMLKEGLAQSINIPSVKTLYLAGIEDTIKNAESFGITTLEDRSRFGLSLVLGGGEVRLIELVNAYGVFATDGERQEISPVIKVTDSNGNVLEEYQNHQTSVVDPKYTRLINDILTDADLRSPLFKNSLGLTQVAGHQVALKTGTTNNYVDAWALGYTPDLVVGVWAGNNNRTPLERRGSSILAAVPIWHDFLSQALSGRPLLTFTKPETNFNDNPILRGELVRGEYHELLYYLGRLDDPQFNNWEEGIKYWLQTNRVEPNRFAISRTSPPSGVAPSEKGGAVQVSINSPSGGSFVSEDLRVDVTVASIKPLAKIEVYLNDQLIDSDVSGGLGSNLNYKKTFMTNSLALQNLLVFRATDSAGLVGEGRVILFKK